ncbi:MAG: hypothetical protein IPL65_21480 [Lewinellaceae bacterium]|nr:hypothetical protein [Lewinellaceae bacterium]
MKKTYEHILAIVTSFVALSWYTGQHWLLGAAVLIGLAALFSRQLADLMASVWMGLAEMLGRIVPRLLLTLIYFLLLLPLALLSRVGGKDQLLLKKPTKTAFKDRNKTFDPSDFYKTW